MSGALGKLRKLKGRSLEELRVRGAQSLCAFAERRGWSRLARLPEGRELFRLLDPARLGAAAALSPDGLLAYFRSRTSPAFFASFDDTGATADALRSRFGEAYARNLIERAGRVLEGRFDLLGLRDLSFGDPVDWHAEPTTGRRAPLKHWSRVEYLNAEVAGDKKVTWELNRHQHFQLLGRAYALTGDERFAEGFASQLASWAEANPPKLGVNWASSLEVAFRSMSWLWALHFFRRSEALTPALFARALGLLYLHARHLETYLSTYFSPNTHLTGEALGLYHLGALLPEFKRAARWRETGRAVLVGQLARHVRPDGTYFEQSSYYHRYTADFYTHFLVLARRTGDALPREVEEKLTALLDHMMCLTRPDGTTPLFGDDDGGRLAQLEEGRAPDDFRSTLSTGAALFGRGDYKLVAGRPSEETLWLLGLEGLRRFDETAATEPAHTSRAFPDGGYFVMRDGWHGEANFMLLDCGPHGADNCGHAHADALSFDAAARGRTLLVDPGTYTYTRSRSERDHFRTSAAHNTLTLDGEPSSAPAAGSFQWSSVARSRLRAWESAPRFDFFEGEHDGYARLAQPAKHSRAVLFLKGDYWVVRDAVEGDGAHSCELHFQFAPGLRVEQAEAGGGVLSFVARGEGGADFTLLAAAEAGDEWRETEGWVSRCYAAREPAAKLTLSRSAAPGRQEFFTFLLPAGAGARLREVEAVGGRAFELETGEARDLLLVAAPGGAGVETAFASSDFAWAWARFRGGAEAPEEVVTVGRGSRLAFGGRDFDPRPGHQRVASVAAPGLLVR